MSPMFLNMENFRARVRPLAGGGGVTITAPAKLNLYLHITDKRADDYHLLESIFVFTESGDQIDICPAEELMLDISGPFAADLITQGGGGPDNLIFRAARALQAHAGLKVGSGGMLGAQIHLQKNLPVAAGIGGGSADAAAALAALVVFWGVDISATDLAHMALKLGADVPACLLSAPCFVAGVGEKIQVLAPGDQVPCLLANPRKALSTPSVFRKFAQSLPIYTVAQRAPVLEPFDILHHTHNDLAGAAGVLLPELREGFDSLANTRGVQFVRLSGSGPTLFALYSDMESAEEASLRMTEACPYWWTMVDQIQMPATFDALIDHDAASC